MRALAWTGSLLTWRLMHDVYAIQHCEESCDSYKALVLHLGGVCWALEHGGNEKGYRALQKLAERESWTGVPYPPAGIPRERGAITVAHVNDQEGVEPLMSGVDRWARAVWAAYADLQPLARQWVRQALKG